MCSVFCPKAQRLLQEISCAEDRAAGEAIANNFDYRAVDAEQREILIERVADALAELGPMTPRAVRRAIVSGTSPIDGGYVADIVADVVEKHVRNRFNLTASQYDLDFTDMAREVERLLAAQLDDVFDLDDAAHAVAEALEEEHAE
jgi:hypothetical protein